MLRLIQRAITLRHEKNFHPAKAGSDKLKGGVLNGKKESKKGGAQGNEGQEGSAQGQEVGQEAPISSSPAPILQLRKFR